jgi:SAM-dependent methyltransferase
LKPTRNHRYWEERAALHPTTDFYGGRIQRLTEGGSALTTMEERAVGDVAGKRLLHLQCHIGTDTLSWAQKGAIVTGVDFSPRALEEAAKLAAQLGLEAEWVEADARALPASLHGRFDLVFASWGVLTWIDDPDAWFTGAAACLAPGGRLFLADGHPMLFCFDDADDGPHPIDWAWPYFAPEAGEPLLGEEPGSYADPRAATTENQTEEWPHSMADIVGAVLRAGLRLDAFEEHRAVPWQPFRIAEPGEDGLWRLPSPWRERIPLAYSLLATKPA